MAERGANRAVYVISVAAELSGMHPQTLRIYERKGLLSPQRTPGGSRRYSDADLAMLGRIQELTEEGLNLAGVKRVLELEVELEALRDALDDAQNAAQQALAMARREQRRDLVPLRQAVAVFRPDPPNRRR